MTFRDIVKIADLGMGWTGTLYSDGTMKFQGDLQGPDTIRLPKASVDRLAAIFKEIQGELPYTSNGKGEH